MPALPMRYARFPQFWVMGALFAAVATCASAQPQNKAIPIAVLDFNYSDTSGEPRNQKNEHEARLQSFMQSLRRDLELGGAYKVVQLACGEPSCSVKEFTPEELFAAARKAGAKLVLYGGVHKMSTLLQWAQVQIVDVETNVVADDRHLSFRGDSDEAWRRAEAFLVKQLNAEPPHN